MNREYYDSLTELFNLTQKSNNMSQAHILSQVAARRFIIASVDANGTFSVAVNPAVHENEQSAITERLRLANANPGKAYVHMQFKGATVTNGVKHY